MARLAVLVALGCFATSPALADRFARPERPFMLELGVNTRHFTATDSDVAFRTTGEKDPSAGSSAALSTSLRFTGATRYDTFLGVEAEAGTLVGLPGSNLAGAYGIAGARGSFGRARLSAELVAGRRWVRYELQGHATDPATWIAEPRVRADLWLGPKLTVGGAVGATLSERQVWMGGIYVGIHSQPFGRAALSE